MKLADAVEGFATSRTHSFSKKQDIQDPADFGLDVLQFYSLLSQPRKGVEQLDAFYDNHKPEDDSKRKEHAQLLQNAVACIGLPVVLKDTDKTFVGVWEDKADDLINIHKLERVPPERVKLVLDDLRSATKEKQQS
jgi:hypothetical protein